MNQIVSILKVAKVEEKSSNLSKEASVQYQKVHTWKMLKQLFWDCFQSYFVVEVFRNFSAELFNFKILSLIPKKEC